jgi:hypothetical protein
LFDSVIDHPQLIASIHLLDVVCEPIAQELKKLKIDGTFAPVKTGHILLHFQRKIPMQELLLRQAWIVCMGQHQLFCLEMLTRIGEEIPKQRLGEISRFAFHAGSMEFVQGFTEQLVLRVHRLHADSKLLIPRQERHTSSIAGAIPAIRSSAAFGTE